MENNFESISITGRYIYGYLCLINFLKDTNDIYLPSELDMLIKEFVESETLDEWQEKIEETLPSFIFENDYESGYYEFIDEDFYILLKEYYSTINPSSSMIIENLILLGFSNLYGGFDSSISMKYLKNIINILILNNSQLPNVKIIERCSVKQRNGWGETVKMDDFLLR